MFFHLSKQMNWGLSLKRLKAQALGVHLKRRPSIAKRLPQFEAGLEAHAFLNHGLSLDYNLEA